MGSGSFLALVARHSLLRRISSSSSTHNYSAASEAAVHDFHAHAHQYDQKQLVQAASHIDVHERFHLDLAERLQHLQLQGSGSAHLNWLLDALASTLSTHSSLRSALTIRGTAAISPEQYAGSRLPNQRADEVLSLLDACSSLKQVADDVERQLGTLQQALQSVGQAVAGPLSSAARIRAAARRLSASLNDRPESLLCTTTKQYRPLAEARASLLLAAKTVAASSDPAVTLLSQQAMDATMLTSLLMLASVVSSCVPAASPKKSSGAAAPIAGACKAIMKYLGAKTRGPLAPSWAAPLRQLQRDLRQEEMGGCGALFQELTSLHTAAANLHAAITNPDIHPIDLAVVRHSVDCLRKGSREAQACITTLRVHMASLFQALIALRLALLQS